MRPLEGATFAVKTFERPDCLFKLVSSIREFFPDTPIVVADDSRKPTPAILKTFPAIDYLELPFDTGLSEGRNIMIDRIKTPFAVILDDDFIFTEETDIGLLVEEADRWPYDIVAGCLYLEGIREQHYEGFMTVLDNILTLIRVEAGTETIPCDIVLNFFAGRVDALRRVRWDSRLKVIEHEDFFWRAKAEGLAVGYCSTVRVIHQRHRHQFYNHHRNNRIKEMRAIAMEKHGWKGMEWLLA